MAKMKVSLILNYIGIVISVLLYLVYSPQLFSMKFLGSIYLFLVFVLAWIITGKELCVE